MKHWNDVIFSCMQDARETVAQCTKVHEHVSSQCNATDEEEVH